MKTNNKHLLLLITILITCGIIFNFGGCSKNLPLAPNEEEQILADPIITTDFGDVAQSDIGTITFLTVEPSVIESMQNELTNNMLTVEQLVEADSGGVVKLGLDALGFCMLRFKQGDLNSDETIKIEWDLTNGHYMLDFGPEGLQFNNKVEFKMLYKAAKLSGVNQDKINLFYYNENLHLWQVIGGNVDKQNKMFNGEITHFSRYAMAHSE